MQLKKMHGGEVKHIKNASQDDWLWITTDKNLFEKVKQKKNAWEKLTDSKKLNKDSKVKDSPATEIFNEIKKAYPNVKFTNIIYKNDEDGYTNFNFDIIGDLPANLKRFDHVKKQPMEKYIIYVLKQHGFRNPTVYTDERNGEIKIRVGGFIKTTNLK